MRERKRERRVKEYTRLCCVNGCLYRKLKNKPGSDSGVEFFKFPDWKKDCGPDVERMTRKRRIAWVSALKQSDITFKIKPHVFVCSRHFVKGQPAWADTDPDWAPSLHVGLTNVEESEDDDDEEEEPEQQKKDTIRKKPIETQIECCIPNCESNSRRTGRDFYSFPTWRRGEGAFIANLTKRHREAWISAVGRSDITFEDIPINARVCSRHFVSGKPAYEMRQKHQDWVPSLNMDSSETKTLEPTKPEEPTQPKEPKQRKPRNVTKPLGQPRKGKRRKRATDRAFKGPGASKKSADKPVGLQWKDLKSRLQTWMADKPSRKMPIINTQASTQANTDTELDFKDFFRNSLEASLDACVSSSSQSTTQPFLTLDLNWLSSKEFLNSWKPPSFCAPLTSTVGCKNCHELKRNIVALKKKLAETTNQDQTIFSDWTKPLEPEEQDGKPKPASTYRRTKPRAETSSELKNQDQTVSSVLSKPHELEKQVTKAKPASSSQRTKPTFQLEWIKQHWFIRYSERLNLMWCHVCRLFAGKHMRHISFVVGTRVFQLSTITQHSKTEIHKDCAKHFLSHKRSLQM